MMKKAIGFKTIGQRILFVVIGLMLLILINVFVFVGMFTSWPKWERIVLVLGLVILGWEWYRWLRVWKNTFYIYDQKKGLTIINFRKKKLFVPKNKIKKIEKIKLSYVWTPSWGFKRTDEGLYVLTSTENVVRISLKEGEYIYISPRRDLFSD